MEHETFRAIKNLYGMLKELDDEGLLESFEDIKTLQRKEAIELLELIQKARDELFRDACKGILEN